MLEAVVGALALLLGNTPAREGRIAPAVVTGNPSAAAVRDGVAVFASGDPEYVRLSIPDSVRTMPDAATRLVVLQGGRVILDRGLESEISPSPLEPPKPSEREEVFTERAEVAPDNGFGVLLVSTFTKHPAGASKATDPPPPDWDVRSEIVWIDADHPKGRWNVALEDGRSAATIVPISHARGVAVSTTNDSVSADLRLYGPDGRLAFTLPDTRATTIGVHATGNGAFLGADVAFPGGNGGKDRGVVVLDLLLGTSWTYAWSYGAEDEPVSWEILDTGILEVKTPSATLRFDRGGKPIGNRRGR